MDIQKLQDLVDSFLVSVALVTQTNLEHHFYEIDKDLFNDSIEYFTVIIGQDIVEGADLTISYCYNDESVKVELYISDCDSPLFKYIDNIENPLEKNNHNQTCYSHTIFRFEEFKIFEKFFEGFQEAACRSDMKRCF
jgi:hypothetical protein